MRMRLSLALTVGVLGFGVPSASTFCARATDSYPQLELGLLAGGVVASKPDPDLDEIGLTLGAVALARIGETLAFGLTLESATLGWRAGDFSDPAVEGSLFPDAPLLSAQGPARHRAHAAEPGSGVRSAIRAGFRLSPSLESDPRIEKWDELCERNETRA